MYSKLLFKRTSDQAFLPERSEAGSAGYDLKTPIDFTLAPGQSENIDLLIQWDPSLLPCPDLVDENGNRTKCVWRADIRSRSGLAFKFNIESFHGLIDQSYRNSFVIKISRKQGNDESNYNFKRGDRIAQFVLSQVAIPDIEEVTEVTQTTRIGGFGSTGK